jgi:osmoprotectant transport system permease protein
MISPRLQEQLALLPELLAHHLLLTTIALGAGIALSLPLAVLATRVRGLRGPLLATAGVVQTVPSLALLALMVPLLGRIGFVPAVLALILYSMLPILRNAVTGILGVEPALIEAARGVGMTEGQMLVKVQLPLAAPVIVAGIRTATVWVVGIATLSTPVGAKSLGNFIFSGLQTQNQAAVLVGCLAAAGLALVLDGLIRLMETASSRRSVPLGWAAGAGLAVVLLAGLAPLMTGRSPDDVARRVTVGSKTFTEQYILAEVIATRVEQAGFAADRRPGMGSQILFDSLANSSVDCYVDYSGTIWANVMQRSDAPDADTVLTEMTGWLKEHHGILCLGRLGFENAYALAMPRQRAEELEIRTIADLTRHARSMQIGGDYEFFSRPEWQQVRETYGLNVARTISLDPTLMYAAVREGQVDVIGAFSSDGRIAAFDLVVLEDPRQAFPPYDAVLLLSPAARARPGLIEALQPLLGQIDDDAMRQANMQVDLDGHYPEQVGRRLAESLEPSAVGVPASGTRGRPAPLE